MALDPNIILDGTATTHPTLATPLGNELSQASGTAENMAQTQMLHTQQQGAQLQNQIAAQQYKDNQIIAGAMANAFKQSQQPPPPNPDGTVPITKPGVDPTWTVNPATNEYVDSNGNPVSHVDGPMVAPNGRPNMFSADMINQVTKNSIAQGANPATVLSWAQGQIAKGQAFDMANMDIASKAADIRKAQSDVQTAQDTHKAAVDKEVASQADIALSGAGQDPASQTAAAQQLVRDMPGYWSGKLQAAGVKLSADPQTGMPTADASNPAFLRTVQTVQQNSEAYQKRQAAALASQQAASEEAAKAATTTATNLQTAQDHAAMGNLNAQDRQALGLTGDPAHDAPITAQAAASSKARGAAATATASETETSTKVGGAVGDAQKAIAGQQSVIDENNKTIAAIDRLTAKGNKGGLPTSILGDLNTNFGNDPDYAQVREAAKFANVQRISQTLSAAGGGTGSARAMGPLLEATEDATKVSKLPLATLRDQLTTANKIAGDNIGLQQQNLSRANAQGASLPKPVTGQAPQPATLQGRVGNLDDVRSFQAKNHMTFDEAYQYLISHGAKIQ